MNNQGDEFSQGVNVSKPQFTPHENLTSLTYGTEEVNEASSELQYSDSSSLLLNQSDSLFTVVKDTYNIASITFLLLGISTLMPWNFFITASDYWMYKFRNITMEYPPLDPRDKTFLQTTYASWIAIASNLPALFALLVNTKLLRFSEVYRNGVSQVIIILLFVATTFLVFVNSDTWQYGFFAFTIVTVVFMNVAGAIFQAGVVGLSALFPKKYMHSMVTGQGLAGVFAAVAQILALLEAETPIHTALTFFLCALGGLFVSFLAYVVVHKTPVFKFYLTRPNSGLNNDEYPDSPSVENSINLSPPVDVGSLNISKQIWACHLSIFMTFFVTMSVFPGITVLVVSQHATNNSIWTGRLFLPVACFFLYSTGDFCGRLACGFLPFAAVGASSKTPGRVRKDRSDLVILGLSFLRILLIPAFMVCNVHPRSDRLPVLFPQDEVYIVLITVLGFTNGFCFCAPMMIAPVMLPIEYREKAGGILTISLLAGLSVGSLLSLPLVNYL